MKKVTLLFALLTLGSMIYFSSCTKCDIENTQKSMSTTLIKGKAYANLDFRNDTNDFGGFEIQYEAVPTGTKLIARLNSQDLDPNPSGGLDYQTLTFETTVDNSGEYQLEVYAGADNLNVTITAEDFEFNQIVNDSTFQMRYFSLPATGVSVSSNSIDYNDLTFVVN